MTEPVRILFVCLGNICRSPSAHGVFRQRVSQAGLEAKLLIESAGTGDWHLGKAPDRRSAAVAMSRGVDISDLRARLVTSQDFHAFDYLLAMDNSNLADLQAMAPANHGATLGLFLDYATASGAIREVPDPYYGGDQGFEHVLDLVEDASDGLLLTLRQKYSL
ncbi:MAG: low molecular weight phosphotyrosine protein phosphatase [Halomonadaceae bacterium]|nr:MAG: low molecular weight phosphotyrosine protein phosphatase [Halomonadaceae bacterium]